MKWGFLSAPKHLLDGQVRLARSVASRFDGSYQIDSWGFDQEIHAALMSLGKARWDVVVDGLVNVPQTGPVVLAVQRRFGLSEQGVVSMALASAGRRVRRVGIPGPVVFEAPMRLTGGVMADPAEVRGLLRDGHVVAVPMRRSLSSNSPGSLDPLVLEPAVDMNVPVLPVAVHGSELGRRWRVVIDPPVPPPVEDGRLGAIEMAGLAREAVAAVSRDR